MLELRDYQKEICKKLARSHTNGKKRVLMNAPTAAGKTVIMSDFSAKVARLGYKVLIVVDRTTLVNQTVKYQADDVKFGVLLSNEFEPRAVTVAMLQTLRSRLSNESYQNWLEEFDFIFFDEVHQYVKGSSYKTICDLANDKCMIVGVTATPWCEKGYLLSGFEEFINEVDIRTLIDDGYLVKPNHMTIDLFDFSKVKVTSTGEYDSGAIDDIVVDTEKVDKVFSEWLKYARNKKTIAFCSTVESAEYYARYFRMNGIRAKAVSAKTSEVERENILQEYASGQIEVLFNVALYVAGFDEPSIECVLFLNPTKILRRYIQCAGRGLRLCPEIGKKECLFLDFVGNSFRHLEVDAIRSYISPPVKEENEDYDQIECPACGFVFNISENECPECGFKLVIKDEESSGGAQKPKNKKEFERLIKLKSMQEELHDAIYKFYGLPCLIKTEETSVRLNGRPVKKWCYGYREDGSPIFKTCKDYDAEKNPYPIIIKAKKTNCWYVFHTICTKYDPKLGALRYYGKKLRKAKRFLEQIQNPDNKVFVSLYKIMD